MSVTITNMDIVDITNVTIFFHIDDAPETIDRVFFYFGALVGHDADEPFGYTNSIRSVSSLGGGNYSGEFAPSDAGVTIGQNIYFTAGAQLISSAYDRIDWHASIPGFIVAGGFSLI